MTIGGADAQHGDAGTERQRSDAVGWQDRDAADGALVGAGAVVADRGGVGEFVALTDQRGEVLEIAGVGCAAEDDFHDRGIPDRGCCSRPTYRAPGRVTGAQASW